MEIVSKHYLFRVVIIRYAKKSRPRDIRLTVIIYDS
jgi:hypothetical protein